MSPNPKENGGTIESSELQSSVGQQQQQPIPPVQTDLVSTCQQVSSHSSKGGLIIDARASDRYIGYFTCILSYLSACRLV